MLIFEKLKRLFFTHTHTHTHTHTYRVKKGEWWTLC